MQPEEVKAQLEAQLPDCQFEVSGDGSHFQVVAIGAMFENLNAVKKQQLIYAVLNDKIADGSIHALVIKTFTPDEWAAQ
ncbi:MAG: BolA family transcriptional regulator [Pseudomonadales bacterium]|nr:BolA family transcriptional regulator [Pseudomonadales bacterium]